MSSLNPKELERNVLTCVYELNRLLSTDGQESRKMKPILFSVDASIALAAVFINFAFAILALVRTSRGNLYITFFFGLFSIMVWNFGDFMTYLTGNQFWFYLSLIGSGMAPALMFHIVNALLRPGRKITAWVILAYVFAGLLAFSSPLALFHPGVRLFVDGIWWNVAYLILLVPFLFSGIIMIFNAIRQSQSEDEKGQLRHFLIAFIIAVFAGLTDLVQILKIPVPSLGHLGSVVYPSILAIGVFKHRKSYDILAQMQMKLELLSEMAAGIAHEIQNPLTSIKGASRLLADRLKTLNHPEISDYHSMIAEEVERLNNILINFQDLARPLRVERQAVLLNNVILKTIQLAEIGRLNLKIRPDLSGDLRSIQADPSLMKQVFLNLLKNAADACGQEGELVIKTETVSPWIKVSFSDNGPGIPPELLKHIFEPFFTTKSTGMGMGLAISQRIVEAHQGRIEVNNLLPKGTQFSILLPI